MKKIDALLRRIALVAVLCGTSGWAFGQTEISTIDELKAIQQRGEYKLMANIELTEDWTPINYGDVKGGHFRGKFDGNGYVIKGLRVDRSGDNRIGLFKSISNAEIRNLGIVNAHLVGNDEVGAIAGWVDRSIIEQCYVENSYIEANDRAGAIAGRIEWVTIIKNCYAVATIKARAHQAGGLVGATGSTDGTQTLSNCYFSGTVQSGSNRAGGILGLVDSGDEAVRIENCVNLATVITGGTAVRIVDSQSNTQLVNNYSLSTTTCNGNAIETTNDQYGDTKKNGANIPEGDENTLRKAFYEGISWDFENIWVINEDVSYPTLRVQKSKPLLSLTGTNGLYLKEGEGLDLSSVTAVNGPKVVLSFFTESNLVEIDENKQVALKETITEPVQITITASSEGFDSADFIITAAPAGVLEIASADNLSWITLYPVGEFKLKNDIDMTDVPFDGLCSSNAPFAGTFDGNNCFIENIKINNERENTGLFNVTDGATIKNLGIKNATITSNAINTAAIVGLAKNSTIDKCYVTGGTIKGADRTASIVGRADATTVTNCYSDSRIESSNYHLGGIIGGTVDGTCVIANCYFAGEIASETSFGYNGGIVGLAQTGTVNISNCYNFASTITGSRTEDRHRIVAPYDDKYTGATLSNNYSVTVPTITATDDAAGIDGSTLTSATRMNFDMTALNLSGVTTLMNNIPNPNALIYVNPDASAAVKALANVVVVDGPNATAATITLVDDKPFTNTVAFTTSDITFTRTGLTAGNMSTLYLPFAAAKDAGMTAYKFNDIEGDYAKFEEVETLEANTAYLFKTTSTDLTINTDTEVTIGITAPFAATANSFLGTFETIKPTGDFYGYSGGDFKLGVENDTEVPAFRAYLQGSLTRTQAAPERYAIDLDGGATNMNGLTTDTMIILSATGAIEIIAPQAQEVKVFSIDGYLVRTVMLTEGYNKIDGLSTGLYLVNNTKVIVK